jgi:hypothetical protein
VLDGMMTYPAYSENRNLKVIDTVCLCVFIFEMLLKIFAQGSKPWRFFIGLEYLRREEWRELTQPNYTRTVIRTNSSNNDETEEIYELAVTKEKMEFTQTKVHQVVETHEAVWYDFTEKEETTEANKYWNCFDFTVIAGCVEILATGGEGTFGVLRLLRVLRLIRVWPPLRVMASGLVTGLTASLSIMGLFMFIMFLYALVGVDLFRENDPFHFLNGKVAFYTLYGMSNMEWLDVAGLQFHGCNR